MSSSIDTTSSSPSYIRQFFVICAVLLVGGCAIYAGENWNEIFGPAEPRQRMETADSDPGKQYLQQVQPLLEQRCVVCHGCYDAPCQLKLSAPEGIDRGASQDLVYSAGRLTEAPLTRLFEDAQTTSQWRTMGFSPVLNEHDQTPKANLQASVMHRMLTLKRDNPLPQDAVLDKSFELGLGREQQCPKPDEIDDFSQKYPLWGMPYALPGLTDAEFKTLENWLQAGARMALPSELGADFQAEIDRWETFLNGDSLKHQLMSRYLYEHWFLGHMYFSDVSSAEFFKVVRSSTPPGEAIRVLPTRRPYDDPGVAQVYYRIWRDHGTVLDKTHMPYALDGKRMAWLHGLFLDIDYTVTELPSYKPEVASNPFIAFKAIPVESRWQFILTEAQFTIMNFIKGPVCRGQVAVDVIRDNFWVFFEGSQIAFPEKAAAFLNEQEGNLRIPSQAGSSAAPIATWAKYAKSQDAYLKAKTKIMSEVFAGGKGVTLERVWDGDGYNQNAALTVFRHFDNASVVKGLVGPTPKTAWLISYPILERIHYLLAAGFDVYGNVGHQMTTRLYMDFLRMEGEFNFLALLPDDVRNSEARDWYRGAIKKQQSYVYGSRADFDQPTSIVYKTDNPKLELFRMLEQQLAPALNREFELTHEDVPAEHREALQRLQAVVGLTLSTMPQITYLNVESGSGENYYYTILRNSAHSNISSMLAEGGTLEPEADTLTVVRNFIGSYPNAYWHVADKDLSELVAQVSRLSDEASYTALMDRYGVRRTSPEFWQHSDKTMRAHLAADPLANALLDYNRLENR